jgi:hypothetical protein
MLASSDPSACKTRQTGLRMALRAVYSSIEALQPALMKNSFSVQVDARLYWMLTTCTVFPVATMVVRAALAKLHRL